MTKFQKFLPWFCCLIFLLAGSIFFAYQQQNCTRKNSEITTGAEGTVSEIVVTNCQKSGGSYSKSENTCVCPVEYDEQLEYKTDTGYCMSAFGTPGGELGETERKLLELEILSNKTADSIVVYEPEEDFSETEKTLVNNLAVDPWLLFETLAGRTYDQIVVSKVGEDLPVFSIKGSKDGKVLASFGLAPKKGQYEYESWYPECVTLDCENEIPEVFEARYPELVIKAKAVGRRTSF